MMIRGGQSMRLLVVRHGQSEADILKVCEGLANYSLTKFGHEQAERTAEYIFKKQFFNCNFGWIEEVDNSVSQRRV